MCCPGCGGAATRAGDRDIRTGHPGIVTGPRTAVPYFHGGKRLIPYLGGDLKDDTHYIGDYIAVSSHSASRAMSIDRIQWAKRIGADSIDGNAPNWSEEGLERAAATIGDSRQGELFVARGA